MWFWFLVWAQPVLAAVDFAKEVHPVLVARCGGCHTGERGQGGLAVNTRSELLRGGVSGPAIVPGEPARSLLIQRVTGEKPPRMPLQGPALTAAEIDVLKRWIEEGAQGPETPVAPRWQPPLRPRRPVPPPGANHPVDAFLKTEGKVVTDAVFARRVWLDLWGLLPTPEELTNFESDRDPNKRSKLIDRLLAHKVNYAGHWISFWNDLLRNDEGVIYHGERKSITRWLQTALEENMPYDRFVATLLNPTKKGDPEGFILGVTWRGEVPASERPPLQAAQNSAQTFLGVNLKCNSCHDSFISSWKLRDAYGLAAFFSAEPLELVRCDVPTGEISKPKFLFPELGPVRTEGTLEQRRQEAARLFTMPENGRLARTLVNRYWKQLFGEAIVEPVDDLSAEPWNPDLLDWLASDFADHRYDLKHLLRTIMTSRAYQLESQETTRDPGVRSRFRGPQRRRLSAEQFSDAIASITGAWRLRVPAKAEPARYVRDWELKCSPLSRALGRPIRDQVVTERQTAPTTLQSLELINGSFLADWLREGARQLVEQPSPPPQNLFDSGVIRRNPVTVDLAINHVKKLWLLVEDVDSYDPARVVPMWKNAVLLRGKQQTKLSELLAGVDPEKLSLPSRLVVDLAGKKFERLRATVDVTDASKASDVNPAVRFFIFDQEPDPKRLVRLAEERPVPPVRQRFTPDRLIRYVYRYALQREPTQPELDVGREMLGPKLTVEGTEDFLWAVLMSPEFQYIW
ncbi:MAG: PSD1 and planctomycete cytochrome C domain-containing protein [Bryobacteraceae bacterium]|nr:PSD1 and planctomycete cytochrome C domain-containing protein [Bryobacteraceae bacterium]MDW8377016.1 PSD1 and planctomycete cytochrome C domain-containing protein [Bryobacterales bacterium]